MNNLISDEVTGIYALLNDRLIESIIFEENVALTFNRAAVELGLNHIKSDFDWSTEFNIPDKYKNIDIEEYFKNATSELSAEQKERVREELQLYQARNLYPVLQLMIYIVDTLRKHKIIWGVGRGSSVASYCLYLIGVHKIDSFKYDLDINEFLK